MDLDKAEFPEVLVSGVLFIQRSGGGGGGANGEAPAIRLNTSGTEVWPRHNMEASEAFRREKTDVCVHHTGERVSFSSQITPNIYVLQFSFYTYGTFHNV